MKKILIRGVMVCFFGLLMQLHVLAQSDPGDPGDDPDRIPLDPGTWVLAAAGVGYGIKKLKDAKQQRIKNYNINNNKN
jgi:hypothetical protein